MAEKLKVYGWTALLRAKERAQLDLPRWIIQCRCVVAAKSKAEVGRLVGQDPRQLFNLCETGNATEIAVATAQPRTFFVAPLDGSRADRYQSVSPEAVS